MANNWKWSNGELVKQSCRIGRQYPVDGCKHGAMVCDPMATSFGDECGVNGCEKVS